MSKKSRAHKVARVSLLFCCLCILTASKCQAVTLSLKQAINSAFVHNSDLQIIQSEKQAYPLQIAADSFTWHPKWLLSIHGDIEKSDNGFEHSHSKKIGLTPSVHWLSPLGTQLDVQGTQFEGKEHAHAHQKHTRWQVSIEQPLLKGANYKVNTQSSRDLLRQIEKSEFQNHQKLANVIYTVIQDYAALLNLMSQVDIQVHRLKAHQHQKKIIQEKIDMGRLPELDGLMHEMASARLEQALSQSRMNIRQLKNKLSDTIGVELDESLNLLSLSSSQGSTQDEQYYQTLSEHYHLKSLELDLQSLKEQEKVIRHQSLWDLRLKAYVTRGKKHYVMEEQMLEVPMHEHLHADKQRFVGLFLSVPLNRDPRQALQLKQNKINHFKTTTQINSARTQSKHQINQLYFQLKYVAEQHRLNVKSHVLAKKTGSIMWEKYLSGFSSHLDWEQMQALELQSAIDAKRSQIGLFLAQVELDYQAGILPAVWQDYV